MRCCEVLFLFAALSANKQVKYCVIGRVISSALLILILGALHDLEVKV